MFHSKMSVIMIIITRRELGGGSGVLSHMVSGMREGGVAKFVHGP